MSWWDEFVVVAPTLVGLTLGAAGLWAGRSNLDRQLKSQADEYDKRRMHDLADEQRQRIEDDYEDLDDAMTEFASWARVQAGDIFQPVLPPVPPADPSATVYTYGAPLPPLPKGRLKWSPEVRAMRDLLESRGLGLRAAAIHNPPPPHPSTLTGGPDRWRQVDEEARDASRLRRDLSERVLDDISGIRAQMRREIHAAPPSRRTVE